MVKEVKAFAANDGKLFNEKWEAVYYDADLALKEIFDKEEMRNIILQNRGHIFEALEPLMTLEYAGVTKEQAA
jgi:hypothetical protein